ncbi:MAG: sugar ABC transporter substrate-binding protein [candidate division WOR-3 bacterium]|nr:sugar ABC transporter substrate-binding protein [candidate division WOR-3 bacterium]
MKRMLLAALVIGGLVVTVISVFTVGAETVKLDYWMWDPSIRAKYEAALARFEEQNPGIDVQLTTMEPKDYWVKLRVMASTGQLPDVCNMSSGYVEEWALGKFLLNMDEYIEEDLNKENYFTKLFDIVRYPAGVGSVYALPFAWVTPVLSYNKDAFDKAGISYPNEEWDWFDFLNAAVRLTQDFDGDGKIDQWGYWFFGRYAHIESWIYQNGGRLLGPGKSSFAPTDEAVEALEFLTDLVLKYEVAPPKKLMEGVRQQDVFPKALAAMWTDGSWNIENTRKILGGNFRWGIAKVPRGPSWEKDTIFAWPDNIAISAKTDHPDAAWKLVKFLSGPGLDMSLYMAGKVPSYKPLAESEEFAEQGKQPEEKMLLLELGNFPMKTSFTQGWSEWRGYAGAEGLGVTGAIDRVINGEMEFDKALEKATDYANKVLDRYYKD